MTEDGTRAGETTRALISVTGIVQGVGFRPFVYQQATRLGLCGNVANTSDGVEIDVEGSLASIEALMQALAEEAPPRSRITRLNRVHVRPAGRTGFEISRSRADKGDYQLVSPDTCICDECLSELFDPSDRRFRYPFVNCTNCGPRFTIIEGLPYDRILTTMKTFPMCPECQAEYEDPGDRRFHAEPNACHTCGPSLWLEGPGGKALPETDPVRAAADRLREGRIVALKGLGGFQLACLATDGTAVSRLRDRKRRPHKPFAVMVENLDDAALHCRMTAPERELLASTERPIVLMEWLEDSDIAREVAPALRQLGAMLPCSPLHYLLAAGVGQPLVMTSGNLSEEPICRTNSEARERLGGIADFYLCHNRPIISTYDDSVAMVVAGEPAIIRRARGYAPLPIELPVRSRTILAVGAELKSTFCLTRGNDAILSQHLGDLKDAGTLMHFERTEALYERMFRARPDYFVHDAHPDYLSTAYSRERDVSAIKVQHHKAHVAACLAENRFTGTAVGVALDGTGFGDDGAIWGGEFFVGSMSRGFTREAHFEYIPLLGGEAAIREPWRMSLAAAWEYCPEDVDFVADLMEVPASKRELLLRQLEAGLNCPGTSSCGRLFDAVAAVTLGRLAVSYEAQAAIEFEAAAQAPVGAAAAKIGAGAAATASAERFERRVFRDPAGGSLYESDIFWPASRPSALGPVSYFFALEQNVTPWVISPARVIKGVIRNLGQGEPVARISRRFHVGLAEVIVRTSLELADRYKLNAVALSGGVFQNRLLLELVRAKLDGEGVKVLFHKQVPTNDGGISLGQAAIAAHHYRRNETSRMKG
ncbi:MAG: carbamoyltransferase HypF [Thermoleophilia bacterium]